MIAAVVTCHRRHCQTSSERLFSFLPLVLEPQPSKPIQLVGAPYPIREKSTASYLSTQRTLPPLLSNAKLRKSLNCVGFITPSPSTCGFCSIGNAERYNLCETPG